MNISRTFKTTCLMLLCSALLAACASTPTIDPRVTALESKLAELNNDTALASLGGDELKTANAAVQRVVGLPRNTPDEERDYRIYAADRYVQIAEMSARERLAEKNRAALLREQERLVLESRTLEADRARAQAEAAEAQKTQALAEAAEAQRLRDEARLAQEQAMAEQRQAEAAALAARMEAEQARTEAMAESERAKAASMVAAAESEKAARAIAEAEAAKAEMESMRNRLSELEAKETERGLLITLGDVLFEFNKSDLKAGAARNLLPLVDVLKDREEQSVIIEGHTDAIGNHDYNMALSERRARSVEQYLVDNGIDVSRLATKGLGPDYPVADNNSEAGRQQNRRVEVILPNED